MARTQRSGGAPAPRERILTAFLQVANERGLDAATTRVVAQVAGVNEVTLFRQFGDKASLALAAVRHFSPADTFLAQEPNVDASTPERAAGGLLACLRLCREQVRTHPELIVFGVGEARRLPEVSAEIARIPHAALGFLGRALEQAAPMLRPEVDLRATKLQWLALLFHLPLLAARGVLEVPRDSEVDELLAAVVRPVIDWQGGDHVRR